MIVVSRMTSSVKLAKIKLLQRALKEAERVYFFICFIGYLNYYCIDVFKRFPPRPFVKSHPAASVAGFFIITSSAIISICEMKVFDID